MHGFISKFSPGHGRAGPDRQFFFVNGRPCTPAKIQKSFNEVYRSFNTGQSPFVVANFIVPTGEYPAWIFWFCIIVIYILTLIHLIAHAGACDINVSPDKRMVLLHNEANLIAALKVLLIRFHTSCRKVFVFANSPIQKSLEDTFSLTRSTFTVQPNPTQTQNTRCTASAALNNDNEGTTANVSAVNQGRNIDEDMVGEDIAMGEPQLLQVAEDLDKGGYLSGFRLPQSDSDNLEAGFEITTTASSDSIGIKAFAIPDSTKLASPGEESSGSRTSSVALATANAARYIHGDGGDQDENGAQRPLFLDDFPSESEMSAIASTTSPQSIPTLAVYASSTLR